MQHRDFDDVRPLPTIPRLRNLSWGLATFGVTYFSMTCTFVISLLVAEATQLVGPIPLIPPPPPELQVDKDFLLHAMILTVTVPPIWAGVVAGCRMRWWVGPFVGLVSGLMVALFVYLTVPVQSEPILIAMVPWATAGLTGGIFSGFRRRFRV